ncbi:mandelate racemase/muconate lactonizing enzyme family protein [Aliirhizobium smilacinae]|uniref:Dipeptide epimerase n=1 Tax=Aliirhizobium smilacinae TaxID=1395944 RepID=A0A5C4X8Z3_9HYPH|nr:dipeptide epimerase [Rhizobium smilacinae]TNM59906.1 dipeptide epimerase [Rhizobium smilacinae]
MRIERVAIFAVDIPFTHQVAISKGARSAASNIFVKIEIQGGVYGWGEGSPYPSLTGETQAGCLAAARTFASSLIGRDATEIDALLNEFQQMFRGHASTRCAFDIALYDILGKLAQMPLFRLFGGQRRELRTDYTIGILSSVEETTAEAQLAVQQGFETVKLKTGRKGFEDVSHVQAVRKIIGESRKLRIDSNQAWNHSAACRNIQEMGNQDLEFCEQPLPYWDVEGHAQLRRQLTVPIALDESVFDIHEALVVVNARAADVINIKLGKCGGIHHALKIETIASASNVICMVGCFGETRLGLTAAAHFAMARPNVRYIDLDSSLIHSLDPVKGGMEFDQSSGGILHLPDAPGLGASIDETKIQNTLIAEY